MGCSSHGLSRSHHCYSQHILQVDLATSEMIWNKLFMITFDVLLQAIHRAATSTHSVWTSYREMGLEKRSSFAESGFFIDANALNNFCLHLLSAEQLKTRKAAHEEVKAEPTRRTAYQFGKIMFFLIFWHVEPHQGLFLLKILRCQNFCGFRLSNSCWSTEYERRCRPIGISEAHACTLHSIADCSYGLWLTNNLCLHGSLQIDKILSATLSQLRQGITSSRVQVILRYIRLPIFALSHPDKFVPICCYADETLLAACSLTSSWEAWLCTAGRNSCFHNNKFESNAKVWAFTLERTVPRESGPVNSDTLVFQSKSARVPL